VCEEADRARETSSLTAGHLFRSGWEEASLYGVCSNFVSNTLRWSSDSCALF
jgi:hypothetical protein